MIKSIFYEQDQENITEMFKDEISKEHMSFLLDHLVDDITVGGLYEFLTIDATEKTVEDINLCVDEIEPIYEDDNFDYFISGIDEDGKRLEIKLSETRFWTS